MHLETTHPSGAEEWACPTCGRRFLMQWPPAYKKVVLEVGDVSIAHTGGKGGLHMGSVEVIQSDDLTLPDGLQPWLKGLKDLDLDGEWDHAA